MLLTLVRRVASRKDACSKRQQPLEAFANPSMMGLQIAICPAAAAFTFCPVCEIDPSAHQKHGMRTLKAIQIPAMGTSPPFKRFISNNWVICQPIINWTP